jgi:hypothetical protein
MWLLFMGAVASYLLPERFFIIEELGTLCRLVGVSQIKGSGGLRESLGLVVLQDVFFEWHLTAVWEDIALCGQVGGSLSAVDFEGCFEGDM